MNNPKISIIVPIYKAEDTIRRLLDSFECQKTSNVEFFLIDNASPDKCGEICQEYVDRDSRFVLHTLKENIGYVRARMYGIKNCGGEFVGFSDSDDYIPENCYEEILDCINKENPDLLTCGFCGVYGNDLVHNHTVIAQGIYSDNEVNEKIMPTLFGNDAKREFIQGFMWKNFYKRQIITNNNIDFIYELVPYEDQIFNIDFVKCCEKVAVIDKEVYYYISNENSITGQNVKKYNLIDEYHRLHRLFEERVKRDCNREFSNNIANFLLRDTYVLFLNAAKSSTKKEIVTLSKIFDNDLCVFIKDYSIPKTKAYKITKKCVEKQKFRFLVNIIRIALRVRG